jgi:hypothetical protein
MSIGGLTSMMFGGGVGTAASMASNLLSQTSSTGQSDPGGPAAAAKAKADAAAAAQASTLAEVRKKGLYAWAQEQKMDALKAKVRNQVLTEHKLDDSSYSKLDAKTQSSIDNEIAQRVKEAMQNALEDQAKSAAQQGKPPAPMIIDISV